jgi:hypothetical protein
MQDDWLDWLLIAKFVYNNIIFEIIKIFLFLADSEQYSYIKFKSSTNISQLYYQAL